MAYTGLIEYLESLIPSTLKGTEYIRRPNLYEEGYSRFKTQILNRATRSFQKRALAANWSAIEATYGRMNDEIVSSSRQNHSYPLLSTFISLTSIE